MFAAVLSHCLSWFAVAVLGDYCNVAMSELTRCVFAMLGARGCVFRDIYKLTRCAFAMLGVWLRSC